MITEEWSWLKLTNKKKIINALKNNEIVAIPTDTVFGLFIKISQENMVVLNLFKKRDKDQPLQVMFPSIEAALSAIEVNEFQESILREELPGNKSIVVPANEDFAKKYLHNQATISLRIPSKVDARTLVEILETVGPCFATSTNQHGKDMLNDYNAVIAYFPDILVLKGTPGLTVASTIVKLNTDSIEILRGGKK